MVQSATCLRVLLVGDDPAATEILYTLLGSWGHDVLVAADPETAVALAGTLRPAAVLLDVRRSRAFGFEVARALRELPWGAAPALVVAIGREARAVRLRAWEAGCTHFLPTPLNRGQLRAILSARPARPGGYGDSLRQASRV